MVQEKRCLRKGDYIVYSPSEGGLFPGFITGIRKGLYSLTVFIYTKGIESPCAITLDGIPEQQIRYKKS